MNPLSAFARQTSIVRERVFAEEAPEGVHHVVTLGDRLQVRGQRRRSLRPERPSYIDRLFFRLVLVEEVLLDHLREQRLTDVVNLVRVVELPNEQVPASEPVTE